VHGRIAVHFAGRGLKDAAAQALGEPQHVNGPLHAGLRRLHGVVLVVDGRGRASQIVDLIDFDVEGERHVVPDQLEALVPDQMVDVRLGAGEEIVDADDVVARCDQPITEVGAEKPSYDHACWTCQCLSYRALNCECLRSMPASGVDAAPALAWARRPRLLRLAGT
jgi:hypothetical protein